MDTSWGATQDFWKHLVVVEATVLGLSVGLISAAEHEPSLTLMLSWVALLLAMAAGSVLVKVGIDLNFDGVLRNFRWQSDVAGIMARVEAKELSTVSEEYRGLFVAASLQMPPAAVSQQIFTPAARELAARYAHQLPTSPLFNMPTRTRLARWLHAHWQGVETAFYAFSIIAFALLIASVVVRTPHAHVPATTSHAQLRPAPAAVDKTPAQARGDSLAHRTPAARRDSTAPKAHKR